VNNSQNRRCDLSQVPDWPVSALQSYDALAMILKDPVCFAMQRKRRTPAVQLTQKKPKPASARDRNAADDRQLFPPTTTERGMRNGSRPSYAEPSDSAIEALDEEPREQVR